MCPNAPSTRTPPSLRTRWERARARIFAFEASRLSPAYDHRKWFRETDSYKNRPPEPNISDSQLDAEFQHQEQIKSLRETARRLLHEGVRDEGLSGSLMRRLEAHLDRLWQKDGWQERFREFRARLNTDPGAREAFDGLIRAGCYADIVVTGVAEVAVRMPRRMPPHHVWKRARQHARGLAEQCVALAEENEAVVQEWAAEYPPVFSSTLARTLRDEAARLAEWAEAFDLRRRDAVRPVRLTYFVAAVHHIKDVTGTYHDEDIAHILEALGVEGRDEGVHAGTVLKWRLRAAKAVRADPNRPLVDLMRELWN